MYKFFIKILYKKLKFYQEIFEIFKKILCKNKKNLYVFILIYENWESSCNNRK